MSTGRAMAIKTLPAWRSRAWPDAAPVNTGAGCSSVALGATGIRDSLGEGRTNKVDDEVRGWAMPVPIMGARVFVGGR